MTDRRVDRDRVLDERADAYESEPETDPPDKPTCLTCHGSGQYFVDDWKGYEDCPCLSRPDKPTGLTDEEIIEAWGRACGIPAPMEAVRRIEAIVRKDCQARIDQLEGANQRYYEEAQSARKDERERAAAKVHPAISAAEISSAILRGKD